MNIPQFPSMTTVENHEQIRRHFVSSVSLGSKHYVIHKTYNFYTEKITFQLSSQI